MNETTNTKKRTPAGNSAYPKVPVSLSTNTSVVYRAIVFKAKYFGNSPDQMVS